MEKIEKRALELWGDDLHKAYPASAHSPQLQEVFQEKWTESLKGNFLEIGCGCGADLEIFSKISEINSIDAIDLGSTADDLAKKYKHRDDIQIKRGNALALEFDNNAFDLVYSFGVFHHTANPLKCISESKRVLKKDGRMFLYLYSSHEDIFLKRVGIVIENIIMKFFQYIPYFAQNIVCILLAPVCWALFSIPARILKLMGYKIASSKIPFYWGTHPFSIIGDVKDRLMSPVNHRFTKLQMIKILKDQNFSSFEVIKRASGLYIYAVK
jgi:SAM-dependent methyltransferase